MVKTSITAIILLTGIYCLIKSAIDPNFNIFLTFLGGVCIGVYTAIVMEK